MKYLRIVPDGKVKGSEPLEYLIEADDDGTPLREIGINKNNEYVWFAPKGDERGSFCDSNVLFAEGWENDPETEKEFLSKWR
jgi:hypothetical protein